MYSSECESRVCVMVFVGQLSECIFQRSNRCEGAGVTVMEG